MQEQYEINQEAIQFKAETRQLLNILIHSLYTDREIFLRELISNASDALTRLEFEMLTNREVMDAELAPGIWIVADKEARTLTISDSGIGMTAEEMVNNLGTIAHSGAKSFLETHQQTDQDLSNIIGQFGVGFYSAFMVAEWIRVVSRSYKSNTEASAWFCDGSDTFRVLPDQRSQRGTDVILKLREDAVEYLEDYRIREIVRKHSDFVPFPIYLGKENEQINRQTAIWRQQPRSVEKDDYNKFYQQLTQDFEAPLAHAHMVVDAPVQMYAVLFIPGNPERNIFSTRKQDGLKLYSRKVLIKEYSTDLLPEYFGFIQGVVDSEDLPLNVSRESIQTNRIITNLRKLVTGKVIDTINQLAKDEPETFNKFWVAYGRYLKQGVATETQKPEDLYPLLRFHTSENITEWVSLDEYISNMKADQKNIYFILGEDEQSLRYSPHLDVLRKHGFQALLLADPIDAFMIVRLNQYKDYPLVNAASANLELPEPTTADTNEAKESSDIDYSELIERFKQQLGDQVSDVRLTDKLTNSPARLVDPEGALNPELQRVYKYMNKEFQVPSKILEINPDHPIISKLQPLAPENPIGIEIILQIYENALLIEGLHPDPARMINRIQGIMKAALE